LMLTTTIEPVQLITIEPAQLPAIEPVLPVENKDLAYWRRSACKLWTLASLAIVAVGGAVTSQPTFGQPPTIGRMPNFGSQPHNGWPPTYGVQPHDVYPIDSVRITDSFVKADAPGFYDNLGVEPHDAHPSDYMITSDSFIVSDSVHSPWARWGVNTDPQGSDEP